jgi:hypothetical protein
MRHSTLLMMHAKTLNAASQGCPRVGPKPLESQVIQRIQDAPEQTLRVSNATRQRAMLKNALAITSAYDTLYLVNW